MRLSPVIAAAALCACTAAPPPPAAPVQLTELAGRTAGAPQPCIPITQTESLRISEGDRHTLLYGSGPTIWVNHLGSGCGFTQTDTLVSEVLGSRYCRGDIVRALDVLSHIPGPSCVLGDFVPYRR